jgi:hypothetical protein
VILDQPPLIFIWRPFYRLVFVPLVLPFFVALRAFFIRTTQEELVEVSAKLAVVSARLAEVSSTLGAVERHGRQLAEGSQSLLRRVDQSEAETARQWAALESLLLAMLSEANRKS